MSLNSGRIKVTLDLCPPASSYLCPQFSQGFTIHTSHLCAYYSFGQRLRGGEEIIGMGAKHSFWAHLLLHLCGFHGLSCRQVPGGLPRTTLEEGSRREHSHPGHFTPSHALLFIHPSALLPWLSLWEQYLHIEPRVFSLLWLLRLV